MQVNERLTEYPSLGKFLDYLNSKTLLRGASSNIDFLYGKYGRDYLALAEDMLETMNKVGVDSARVFESYIFAYLMDLARFEKSGEYNNGTFEEIRDKIYDNVELMNETYLPGLFVAYGFTSLLHEKYRFCERSFIRHLDRNQQGIEIGFGDGFYLWTILKRIPGIKVSGLDISQSALDFTAKLLSASGFPADRFDLRLGNVCERLSIEDASQDWCILTEVIEHVADPVFSMGEIVRIMKPGGVFFISTVMDSNHMDHITNFESPEVVKDLLRSSGFAIEDSLEYAVRKEIKDVKDRAVGLAFVCRKI
jgi:ubiquinone/menaquinone biosynthesis C-methylase UbiE